MMKFSERREKAKAASAAASQAALHKQLIVAVEGMAEHALTLLNLYDARAVTPAQNAEFELLIDKMKAELQPIVEPIDRAREILAILDETRAAYA